jgi:hypothetical protein
VKRVRLKKLVERSHPTLSGGELWCGLRYVVARGYAVARSSVIGCSVLGSAAIGSAAIGSAAIGSAAIGSAVLAGCVELVETDSEETFGVLPPPTAEFDPAQQRVPFPNNLLRDPVSGRLTLPPQCGEEAGSAAAQVRATLNELDGFGTSRAVLRTGFSEAVDPESAEGRIFLVRLAEHGVPLTGFEGAVPVEVSAGTTPRADATCSSSTDVPELAIRPTVPLKGGSTYGVVMLRGITNTSGIEYEPSPTWGLVRQETEPVQISLAPEGSASPYTVGFNATPFDPATPTGLATLVGLDLLWRAHAPVLGAFDRLWPALEPGTEVRRDDVLLAWSFDTQTIQDPLDPAVPDSPASVVVSAAQGGLTLPPPLAGEGGALSVEQFFAAALPGVPCSSLGCEAIGAVYAASPAAPGPSFANVNFQSGGCYPVDSDPATRTAQGAWSDPLAPTAVCDQTLPLLVIVPATPPPDGGYPTVIFAHGLGRSKEDLLVLGGTLAASGFASVAIDAVAHGVRAVQVITEPSLGCGGAGEGLPCTDSFGPTCAPQCFAPILSANLAATRDSLRQTVLDQLALAERLRGCTGETCGRLQVNPARIAYLGQSLGALIGGVSVAMSGIPVGVLNVGGADWMQILSDTETVEIRCPLVDTLIASGVIAGEPWNLGMNPGATCLGDGWKTDPGFIRFAEFARWILDPVDGVNYAELYRDTSGPSVFLAEVVGDSVVPNSATEEFGTLLGLSAAPAAVAAAVPPDPTPAAAQPGGQWLTYSNLAGDAASMFPGNAYGHGSLLAPAEPSADQAPGSGELGTLRLRVDTLTFLLTH